VVAALLDFQLARLPLWRRWAWLALFLPRLPYYAALDTLDRGRFNVAFYRHYARVPRDELERWAEAALQRFWMPRLFPRGLEPLGRHRAQGHRSVLIAGGLDVVLRPLAAWLGADLLAGAQAELAEDRLAGRLVAGPMAGQAKAEAARRTAAALGVDLAASYAYGDSYHDLPFLRCVGHPVAVNPDWRLRRYALRHGWPICVWRPGGLGPAAPDRAGPTVAVKGRTG
jgi:HAD superfamily hydrolase (TIGR01490 family)